MFFDEDERVDPKEFERPPKSKCARIIRSYRRIAERSHGRCHFCGHEIEAGDEYEGFVWVGPDGLWVKKEHTFCVPDDDEPSFDENEDEGSIFEELPKAA